MFSLALAYYVVVRKYWTICAMYKHYTILLLSYVTWLGKIKYDKVKSKNMPQSEKKRRYLI
jgi:hypothetical protein